MDQRAIFAKIGFNTIIQIAGKAISILLGFITVALLTRYLGVAGYGNFTLVFAYLSFFGIIADFGLQLTIVRELSQQKEKHHLLYGTYFGLKLILVSLSILLAVLALSFFSYSSELKTAIVIGALGVGIGSLSNFGTAIFQSNIRLDLVTLIDVFTKIVTVGLISVFVFLKLNFYYIISTVLIGNLIGFLLTMLLLKKMISFKFSYNFQIAKKIIFLSFPVGLTSLFSLAYFKLDTIMLSVLRNQTEVGIYSLSYKIFENILILWGFYMASVYPLLAKVYYQNRIKFHKIMRNSLFLALGFSFFIITIGFIFAPLLIRIFGGEEFSLSIFPFRIILFSIPLLFINNLLYHIFVIYKKNYSILLCMFFSLLLNFFLNLIFIPKGGYIAASYITVLSEVSLLIFYLLNFINLKTSIMKT